MGSKVNRAALAQFRNAREAERSGRHEAASYTRALACDLLEHAGQWGRADRAARGADGRYRRNHLRKLDARWRAEAERFRAEAWAEANTLGLKD